MRFFQWIRQEFFCEHCYHFPTHEIIKILSYNRPGCQKVKAKYIHFSGISYHVKYSTWEICCKCKNVNVVREIFNSSKEKDCVDFIEKHKKKPAPTN